MRKYTEDELFFAFCLGSKSKRDLTPFLAIMPEKDVEKVRKDLAEIYDRLRKITLTNYKIPRSNRVC